MALGQYVFVCAGCAGKVMHAVMAQPGITRTIHMWYRVNLLLLGSAATAPSAAPAMYLQPLLGLKIKHPP